MNEVRKLIYRDYFIKGFQAACLKLSIHCTDKIADKAFRELWAQETKQVADAKDYSLKKMKERDPCQ